MPMSEVFLLPPGYLLGLGLAAASAAFLILALWRAATSRFDTVLTQPYGAAPDFRPVTVLKPLCGKEPRLYECLRSFCEQDYPDMQIVFGVGNSEDDAIAVVEQLIAEFPGRDLALMVNGGMHGSNLKVGNLINMAHLAKHDIIVVSDSDTLVARDCLAQIVTPFADAATGAVSCLYKAAPDAGLASKLGALFINDWFLSSAVVDARMRDVAYCFGPLSAVRRSALDAIGGFAALSSQLADDFMMGRLIAAAGYKVRLSQVVPSTIVAENFRSLFWHELRWARTVKAVKPGEHFLSAVMEPLPLLAALLLPYPGLGGWAILGAVIMLRVALHYLLHARFRFDYPACPWLLPLRECLCFAVWAASFLGSNIRWRHRRFAIGSGGELIPLPMPVPSAATGVSL
jgi:ceramide glucosyltransferase